MKNAHTPGAWSIYKDQESLAEAIVSDEAMICSMATWASEFWVEREANANLIAAAPDLLEALRELLAEAEEGFASCPLTKNKARAAIAKAEGVLK